jgi:hypothetical protein
MIPRTHWTTYGDMEGGQYLAIWRQWRRRVWNVVTVKVG